MSKNIGDRHKWCAILQKAACQSMAQRVSCFALLYCHTCIFYIPLEVSRNRCAGLEFSVRMNMADKHIIAFGIQSPIFQIVNDGITNYREQGQCVDLLRFLLCIGDQFLMPVQIFEFQCADVSCPHAKQNCQKKHRIIPFSNRIAAVNNG